MELQTLEQPVIDPLSTLRQRMRGILQNTDMSISSVDKAFKEMISERGIHAKLGITSGLVRTYRYNLNNGISISTDTKLALLKKSGWSPDNTKYNDTDLVALLKFNNRTSQDARDHGPEYVVEKWKLSRR